MIVSVCNYFEVLKETEQVNRKNTYTQLRNSCIRLEMFHKPVSCYDPLMGFICVLASFITTLTFILQPTNKLQKKKNMEAGYPLNSMAAGLQPDCHDLTVASNTRKFDSGILKALKFVSSPSAALV